MIIHRSKTHIAEVRHSAGPIMDNIFITYKLGSILIYIHDDEVSIHSRTETGREKITFDRLAQQEFSITIKEGD